MRREGIARVFFALWPDDDVREALHALARDRHPVCHGRVMRPGNIHLTLVFLGDVALARLPEIISSAAAVPGAPIRFDVDRVVHWRHNHILWAGCSETPTELISLAGSLGHAMHGLGFRVERRPFAAHITLLRDARCEGTEITVPPIRWAAREFVLCESVRGKEGAVEYQIAARFPLDQR